MSFLRIGSLDRVFFIAEAGVNHNGDPGLARSLVDAAVEAKADAVKFQSFRADRVASAGARKVGYQVAATGDAESQEEMLRRLELSAEAHADLSAHCRRRGILFLSTPFDIESVDLLERLDVPLFKVASGEVTNVPLLRHVAAKRRPVILSTGMSTLDEVGAALRWLVDGGAPEVTLLHCVTEYPAPAAQVNLRAMATLRETFRVPVGYSDHASGTEIAVAAAALGASVIEKHFTLDRRMPGPDHAASLEPAELRGLVTAVRNVETALGDGVKRPAACEIPNLPLVRRSLCASVDIPAGTVLSEGMVTGKRPGTGIPVQRYDELMGRRVSRSFRAGEMLCWEGLGARENQDR